MSDQPDGDTAQSRAVSPVELSQLLRAQIEARLRENLGSSRLQGHYYVIRSQRTGVLSVLASSTLGQDHDVVWGPQPFADCISYVNSVLMTRMAEQGEPDGAKAPRSAPGGTKETP